MPYHPTRNIIINPYAKKPLGFHFLLYIFLPSALMIKLYTLLCVQSFASNFPTFFLKRNIPIHLITKFHACLNPRILKKNPSCLNTTKLCCVSKSIAKYIRNHTFYNNLFYSKFVSCIFMDEWIFWLRIWE